MTKFLTLFFAAVLLTACASHNANQTLYAQLKGEQGLENIVDSFIKHIASDEQVFHYFAKASVSHFRAGFITHLCDATGGPCEYKGDNMVDIHTGMNINEADFNRIVELLVKAMEDNNISYPVQNQVLAKLAPHRAEIIKR